MESTNGNTQMRGSRDQRRRNAQKLRRSMRFRDRPSHLSSWRLAADLLVAMFAVVEIATIEVTAWVVLQPQQKLSSSRWTRSRRIFQRLNSSSAPSYVVHMGGYYNEPIDMIDQSETHMVFGVRCYETKVVAYNNDDVGAAITTSAVRGLQPLEEIEYGQLMVDHLLSQSERKSNTAIFQYTDTLQQQGQSQSVQSGYMQQKQHYQQLKSQNLDVDGNIDWTQMKIVEIGGSSTGLFAFHCLGVGSVVQCHPDPVRLSVVEYAHLFLDNKQKDDHSRWATHVLDSEQQMIPREILQDADWIIFTLDDMNRLYHTLQQMAAAAQNNGILVPQSLLPESQLHYYDHTTYPDGILRLHGLR